MEAGSPSPCLGRLTLKEVMGGQRSRDVEELLRRSRAELLWVQRQLSLITRRSAGHPRIRDKLPNQQLRVLPPQSMERWRLLEEKNRCLRLEVATLRHERQQCRSLKNELHQALQEKSRLNQELSSQIQRASQYERVKSDYEQLRETCTSVIQERDSALRERSQLQGRLEQLEQVLQHMHKAAERQQQLERDHELALEVLHARQQEIRHLQKVQVEAEKEHEGTVHQLEARVRELEQRCKSQAEQFSLLYQQLERFCLQSGTADTVGDEPLGPVDKTLIHILSGLASQVEEGHTNSGDRWLKPKLLPVTPTSEVRTQAAPPAPGGSSSPQRDSQPEMDGDLSRMTRSETRFTGKVRLCTARYSYNPYDGPNDHPEAELPLVAGKYLYIYGTMDDDGFYRGELPDGQRGLVPSNFVDFVQDKDAAPTPGSDDSQETEFDREEGRWSLQGGKGSPDADELEAGLIPYPRRITLIKQLARSVIVSWEPPAGQGGGADKTGISAYDVLVDQEVRFRMPPTGRRKLLIEKLELSAQAYRISIRCVTQHGVSDELRCSLLVGRGVVLAPTRLRLDNVTQHSADLSWWPCDSNYKHAVLLDGVELALVGPGRYRCRLCRLSPMTAYRVTVVTQPHRVPWRLPLEQREQREASLDFCTLPAGGLLSHSKVRMEQFLGKGAWVNLQTNPWGPPLPPQEVRVLCGQTPGVLHVSWKPPALTPSGMSNGACVTGYAVCTRGQRIAEVMYPAAEHVTVEMNHIWHLEVRELVVRTLSAQGESQDSEVATIPQGLLLPPAPPPPPHILLPVCPRLVDLPLPSISTDPHIPNPTPQSEPLFQPHLPNPTPQSEPLFQPHQPILQPHLLHSTPQAQFEPSGDSRDREVDRAYQCTEPSQPWALGSHPPSTLLPPTLEAPPFQTRHSPSPQRILPQPQGAPIPRVIIKAIAREATQRAASSMSPSSDEEEDYKHENLRKKGTSVHEFLADSELGRQRGDSVDYPSESSRGSDLSAIMEEDEEELHSVMDKIGAHPHRGSPRSVLKILGSCRCVDRSAPVDTCSNRRSASSGGSYQRRAITVPSIEITPESNSEESISLAKEQTHSDANLAQTKLWPPFYNGSSEHVNDGALSQQHDGEARPKELSRIFVALFDYDPLSMSPNHDRAVEELSFQEGQILKVFGDKDRDGFYCGEINGRTGLIPCNMVAEIEAGDQNTTDQLVHQGFLPLSTPVAKIDRKRQGGRQPPTPKRKMVALYDYDPRENSPNTDMEAELTFSAGDIITILGEIDEDGFYYGEMNGQRGLVPSNFLEEVPNNVEIHLTGTKTVPQESKEPPQTTASPSPGPYIPAIRASVGPQNLISKRKKGLFSKGKRLWKRLAAARRAT